MIAPDATTADGEQLLALAQAVVRTSFRLPERMVDDAVQTAALAGWEEMPKWNGTSCTLRTFLWSRMRLRVIDWIRHEVGRRADRWNVKNARSLDVPTVEDAPLIEILEAAGSQHDIELVDTQETLRQLFAAVDLSEREKDSIRGYLADETTKTTAERWGMSRARVSQVRQGAYAKLRAAA